MTAIARARASILVGAVLIVVGLKFAPAAEPAPDRPWRIVVLNDGDARLPAFVAVDRGMREVLTQPGRHRADLFPEALDMLRFSGPLYEEELVALLRKKYGAQPVDAVV